MEGFVNGKEPLQVCVLGNLAVLRRRTRMQLPRSRKTRALLAYLAVTARRHSRDRLCAMFWTVPDDPRAALRWSLTRLRAFVDEPDCRRIIADRENVGLDLGHVTVDIASLRNVVRNGTDSISTDALRQAAEALESDFLEGIDLPNCHEFQVWCTGQREETRRLRVRLLTALVTRLEDAPDEALRYARALSLLDPANEAAQATLVRLLRATGRWREAQEQFERARRRLDEFHVLHTGALRHAAQLPLPDARVRAHDRIAPLRGAERLPARPDLRCLAHSCPRVAGSLLSTQDTRQRNLYSAVMASAPFSDYPRDLAGYGRNPPDPRWPDRARVAVQFVVNYEEGGERNVLHGDATSEAFLSDVLGAAPWPGQRHMNVESMYEYGSRAGFWRLWRLFTERNMPVTVFGVATALARSPEAVAAMREARWEIASHGLKWIDYKDVPEAEERAHLAEAVYIHTHATGERPLGWYTGRGSSNTLRLVLDDGGFLYSSDSYADDLPYWVNGPKEPHLIIPYTLDANDMRFINAQGFGAGDEFFNYLKDSFDVLYAEGEQAPKMMSVGLHCRLVGRPGRAAALMRFLDYIAARDRVWVATRLDIARHWHREHRALAAKAPTLG